MTVWEHAQAGWGAARTADVGDAMVTVTHMHLLVVFFCLPSNLTSVPSLLLAKMRPCVQCKGSQHQLMLATAAASSRQGEGCLGRSACGLSNHMVSQLYRARLNTRFVKDV